MFKHVRWPGYVTVTLTLMICMAETLFSLSPARAAPPLVGPKQYYMALGDSLAYGYQPDLNIDNGYVHDFALDLGGHGGHLVTNLSCIGETTTSMIEGNCPFAAFRKVVYSESQLQAALDVLHQFPGRVSPVTIDIGANDVLPDVNIETCSVHTQQFEVDLSILDSNLRFIVAQLHAALTTLDGQSLGDLVLINAYNPIQKTCPADTWYAEKLNAHLAEDLGDNGRLANVFSVFNGGPQDPGSLLCIYTWICSQNPLVNPSFALNSIPFSITPTLRQISTLLGQAQRVHATTLGYQAMANVIERTVGY